MKWYLDGLGKYAAFSGRARRKEYWYFLLFNCIVSLIFAVIDMVMGTFNNEIGIGLLSGIYALAVTTPQIAVTVRRLHDMGRSAWWLSVVLIPLVGAIYLLVLLMRDSNKDDNQFGPNPKRALATISYNDNGRTHFLVKGAMIGSFMSLAYQLVSVRHDRLSEDYAFIAGSLTSGTLIDSVFGGVAGYLVWILWRRISRGTS